MNATAFQAIPGRMYHSPGLRRLVSLLLQTARRGDRPPQPHNPVAAPAAAVSTPSTCSRPEPTVQDFIERRRQVVRVDDPFGENSLVAVSGEVSASAIEELRETLTNLGRGCFVHLDLASSSIRTSQAMQSLESIADELESRGVVLRVVGLDPQHPMLSQTL